MSLPVPARAAAAALALAAALPALAYVLPPAAILERTAERRAQAGLASLEVLGTLRAEGPEAGRIAVAAGLPSPAGQLEGPARLLVKAPGRCRLELAPAGLPEAERPFLVVKEGQVSGRGLDALPGAAALLRGVCTLLALPPAPDPAPWADALGRRGVALQDATLGRFDGRIAYVIGGRARDAKPLAFFDKETWLPVRLVAAAEPGGALADVRLLGWGSPTGGDWFPRAAELWEADAPRIRFATEKAAANPRLPDALF
jgi:hypothetical protein